MPELFLKSVKIAFLCALTLFAQGADGQYIINTIAGNGNVFYSGDGGPATSAGTAPADVKIDAAGNIYIGDSYNARVRKVSPSGIILTCAGGGAAALVNGAPATSIQLQYPEGIAIDATGNIYIADAGTNLVSKVTPSGAISIVAGNDTGVIGDGGPATAAALNIPTGVVLDAAGNLYIAESGNNCIRKVNTTGIISTYAGNGGFGSFSGDGGMATNAGLYNPDKTALDATGNLYIADTWNNRIRKVTPSGIITTVAGNGTAGFSGNGGPATTAELQTPRGVAIDAVGNVYISDYGNNVLRKISAAGIISTIAGTGTFGFSGDGGSAIMAQVSNPFGLALDAEENIYLADNGSNRVRKLTASASGISNTEAGSRDISLVLFPNPSSGSFSLRVVFPNKNKEDASIVITNAAGEQVIQFRVLTNEDEVIPHPLPSGGYWVTAITNSGSAAQKVVVE